MSQITVIKVNKVKADKGYTVVELAYKTDDGKTKGMKIFPFGDQKEIADVAGNSKVGDVLEAQFRQNQKGFWEFGSLKATGTSQAVTTPTGGSKGGTWETPEERHAKQALISRQAVLNTSVAFFEAAKVKPDVSMVLGVAQQFLDFVNGKQPQPAIAPQGDVE